jgi:iron(III) transport system ATP-binding protein
MTQAAGIEFERVSKAFGETYAVRDISFRVAPATLVTLLGPSGCGKTTTLRMIAGLESPTAGRVLIGGRDVTALPPAERNVSLVFQSYALFPHMSVLENVAYGLVVSGLPKAQASDRARAALEGVGLAGLGERWPSELSGGQQQRVAVARALVLEPAVLLFDEPLSNLDARLRRQMREEIRALQTRLGLTVVYVTHDQSEALAVSDEIIVMNQGVIAQQGRPRDLYERPASRFVAGFMGEGLLLEAQAAGSELVIGPLRVPVHGPLPGAGRVSVAVRPEAWAISSTPTVGLAGEVLKCAYLGSHAEYVIATSLGELFVVSPDVASIHAVGGKVALTLRPEGVAVVAGGD